MRFAREGKMNIMLPLKQLMYVKTLKPRAGARQTLVIIVYFL